jgi:homoserine O-succinyltransferase
MPIRLDKNLPAYKVLEDNGVFVMDVDRADTQDVRPLRIGILKSDAQQSKTPKLSC